jgi:hypothetical protein
MSGMPRPAALHNPRNLLSKNRSGQVLAENALERAIMLLAEASQEDGHIIVLILRAREIVREAAPREARRDLGVGVLARRSARRSAHANDVGTCETVAMW